jgi:hypothetical protein
VTGHVHNADLLAAGQPQPGETEINGHFTGFFFFKPIRVNARQRPHECGFPVIDVARRPDNVHDFWLTRDVR